MINKIKAIIPARIKKSIKRSIQSCKNFGKSNEEIFTNIYDNSIWGNAPDGSKYFSGGGSVGKGTEEYKKSIIEFINNNKINSIFEIGCGDFRIMKSVLNQVKVKYTGSDTVKNLIDYLNKEFADKKQGFMLLDAAGNDEYPEADLCIIRQVLQHLSNKQIKRILNKTQKFKYVIITEHLPIKPFKKNVDMVTGNNIRLVNSKPSGVYLDTPPFSQKCKTLLSYRSDLGNIPAEIVTSLIENNCEVKQ